MFYARVAAHPQVALASPIVELDTYAFDAHGERVPLHLIGIDPLVAAPLSPALLPQPDSATDRTALFDPRSIYLTQARDSGSATRACCACRHPTAAPSCRPAATSPRA